MATFAARTNMSVSGPSNVARIEIDKYLIYHYGWKSGEGISDTRAMIICYNGRDLVGYINFYAGDQIPRSTIEQSMAVEYSRKAPMPEPAE